MKEPVSRPRGLSWFTRSVMMMIVTLSVGSKRSIRSPINFKLDPSYTRRHIGSSLPDLMNRLVDENNDRLLLFIFNCVLAPLLCDRRGIAR